jgi:hypothetical protein
VIHLGSVVVSVRDGLTTTRFADGRVCHAHHTEQPGQADKALELGYPSAEAMNREHDLTHSLLAWWLGLACSPTLYGMATGIVARRWREEEAAVLAVQRYARAMGVDLVEVAERG